MAATVEYIFMAVPDESSAEDTLRLINDKTSGMSTNYVLALPELKVRDNYMSGCGEKEKKVAFGLCIAAVLPFCFSIPLNRLEVLIR